MDEFEDECTAVLKISKKFDEKFGSFNDKKSTDSGCKFLVESNWTNKRLSTVQLESEVVCSKAQISQLQLQVQTLEKQLAEEKLFHVKEIKKIKNEHEEEKKEINEAKLDAVKMSLNYENAKEEIIQLKGELESCKVMLQEKNKVAGVLHAVQSESDENKLLNSQKVKSFETEINQLKNTINNLTDESDRLRLQLKNKVGEVRKLESMLEDIKYQMSILNQRNKDYELERSQNEENLKQSKWIQSRLQRCEELEEENKKIVQELLYLKATKENSDLLNEKCRSLQEKLERNQERCGEFADLQLENEILKKKVADFEPLFHYIPTLKCATDAVKLIEDVNRSNQLYVEANGSLKMSLHKCQNDLSTIQLELQSLKMQVADETVRCETLQIQNKKLKQKLLLVIKERDSYKGILDSYEGEMTQTIESSALKRIKLLEETSESLKKGCLERDAEIQKYTDLTQQLKREISVLNQQLVQERNKSRSAIPLNPDANIILSLQEKVVELERKLQQAIEEKDRLQLINESNNMKGHYNPFETKAIKMRSTPYSLARNNLTQQLESAKEENQRLKMKMKTMVESHCNIQDELTAKTTQALATIGSVKEQEELKAQLESAELLNKRLKENFEKISCRFKSLVSKLLGYRVEGISDVRYRLISIFAETPEDFFIFEESQDGEFNLMENDFSKSFPDLIEHHLKGHNALPAFVSAVTILLRERQLMDSTSI